MYKLSKVRQEIRDLSLATGVVKQIYTFWKQEQELRLIRIIERINTANLFLKRFLYYSPSWNMGKEDFTKLITSWIEHSANVDSVTTFIGKILKMNTAPSRREQFFVLSTISNYHWLGYPSTHPPHKIIQPTVSYNSHILTSSKKKYLPTSPRNRIMYFILNLTNEILEQYINYIHSLDNPEFEIPQETLQPTPKKRHLA